MKIKLNNPFCCIGNRAVLLIAVISILFGVVSAAVYAANVKGEGETASVFGKVANNAAVTVRALWGSIANVFSGAKKGTATGLLSVSGAVTAVIDPIIGTCEAYHQPTSAATLVAVRNCWGAASASGGTPPVSCSSGTARIIKAADDIVAAGEGIDCPDNFLGISGFRLCHVNLWACTTS